LDPALIHMQMSLLSERVAGRAVESSPCFGGMARSALASQLGNGREIECSS
jgi:hypothetical protein